ncbi:MAG TPA: glycosyl hydrolase 108 family protein [Steroidobacteraceae bacterium]|nr:glycosyl hydrolase 108 family protein [Steroidobacteraceae bacterium]
MPSPQLSSSLVFVLRWEGGFVDHPDDPGGRTNRGVTQKVYDQWRKGQGLAPQDVKLIGDDEVTAIYETGYWLAARCDRLDDPLYLVQFDTAVNMGVNRAVRFLQEAVQCPIDGDFGPTTEKAYASCDRGAAAIAYCKARESLYDRLIAKNPKLAAFRRGWLNRLNALRQQAGLPVVGATRGGAPVPEPTFRIPDIGQDPAFDL